MEPADTESGLILSDLSPDDNGRVIVCSAENVVGKSEATLQLDIHCKACSAVAWMMLATRHTRARASLAPSRSLKCFLISSGNAGVCALFSLLSPGKSY